MNADDATAFITLRLQPETDPVLPSETVVELLKLAACPDDDGRDPDHVAWDPTYSTRGCYRAIAEGYSIKHALAVGRFEFTTDGQTFRRQQTLDQLDHQRRTWTRKLQSAPSTLGTF